MTSHHSNRSSLLAIAATVAAGVMLTSCGGGGSASGGGATAPGGVSLVKPDKFTVCTHLSYKPFEYKDPQGKVIGFDADLMEMVAKKLNTAVEWVDIDFASMQSGAVFAAKKCDISAGAITITDKRKQAVLFSDPYFTATQALITKKGSGVDDLAKLRGKKIGVQTDTTGKLYAEQNKAANGYNITVYDDVSSELTGVVAGNVDAAVNDNGAVLDFAKDNPNTEVTKEFDTGEVYGFIGQKNNENATKLMGVVNDVLKTSKSDGSYKESYKKWFGKEPTNIP